MKTWVTVTILLATHGALAEDLRNEPIEKDTGRFIERLMKAVPRGSSMQDAIEFVESHGFTNCTPHTNAAFSRLTSSADFVLCEREYAGWFYEVALIHHGRAFQRVGMRQRPVAEAEVNREVAWECGLTSQPPIVSVDQPMSIHRPRSSIKGVFFDYDGVLTTDKTGSLTTCRYLSSQTGIELGILTNALRRYNDDLTIGQRSHADIWPQLCESLGQSIPLGLLPLAFQSTPCNQPMFALAEELKRSCVIGIITDNKKDRIDYLRRVQQLDRLFAPIVVSAEMGCTKEDKRMFEAALQLTGLQAGEAVFIDNTPGNLVAPRALGMQAIHFDDVTNDVAGLRRTLKEEYGLQTWDS